MKIALVRLSSLGDIILAMASLQMTKRQIPDCDITWVADRRFADVLDHQLHIDRIIRVDLKGNGKQRTLAGISDVYRQLKALGRFDAVIDLHGMLKSACIAKTLQGPVSGFSRMTIKEPMASLLYRTAFDIPLELPAAQRYARLIAHSLNLEMSVCDQQHLLPFLGWEASDTAFVDQYFSHAERTILLVPETSVAYKNYPPEKCARLATLLGGKILVCHGNEQEYRTALSIAQSASNVTVLPRLNLNQLKALVARTQLVIGADSGPTHMAWACGVPSITLFGATPVCIQTTARNRVIKTTTHVNLRKPDSTDLSVHTIREEDILHMATELLEQYT